MKKVVKYNKLYDCYHNLLTENERLCFIDYYLEDLSLQEIADNNNVSRSAVHKTIKVVEEKLDNYENKLNLVKILEKVDCINKNNMDKIKTDIRNLIN